LKATLDRKGCFLVVKHKKSFIKRMKNEAIIIPKPHIPSDISQKILLKYSEAFELLKTLEILKPKQPVVFFYRIGKFVPNLIELNLKNTGAYFKDIIIYDLDKLEVDNDTAILIAILEELVHCYCETCDETKAGLIVASLIPEIYFDTSAMQYKRKNNA